MLGLQPNQVVAVPQPPTPGCCDDLFLRYRLAGLKKAELGLHQLVINTACCQ